VEIKDSSALFPRGLKYVESPPKQLFVVGSVENLSRPSLAIVGARKATPYGLNCAARFARLAAAYGIVVVSGGAIGCDQAAHSGALSVGGTTVVVLGCGADVVYPSGAKKLFDQILAEGGTIVSEAPWGAPPTRWSFRKRNRIIAGLAQTTLIVEAGLPSGTFSTADATLSQGKEVLAIPGSIFAKESKGANQLIAQGAVPIIDDTSFADAINQVFGNDRGAGMLLFDSLVPSEKERTKARLVADARQQKVLAALTQEPKKAEDLLGIGGDDVTEVIRCLSAMEFAGSVLRLRDGRYAENR
jgi:DNA processing protein